MSRGIRGALSTGMALSAILAVVDQAIGCGWQVDGEWVSLEEPNGTHIIDVVSTNFV